MRVPVTKLITINKNAVIRHHVARDGVVTRIPQLDATIIVVRYVVTCDAVFARIP